MSIASFFSQDKQKNEYLDTKRGSPILETPAERSREIRKSLLLTLEFPPQKGGTQRYYWGICQNLLPEKIVVLTSKEESEKIFNFLRQLADSIIQFLKLKIKNYLKITKLKIKNFTASHQLQATNYSIYRRNLLSKLIWPHWLPILWHLWRIIKKEKIELIQVGQVLPCGTATLIVSKILKVPYIVYAHGLDILAPQKNRWKKRLMKLVLSRAELVVSNSEFTKNEVVKLGIEGNKVSVIYPMIETGNWKLETGNKEIKKLKIEKLREKYNLQNKKILLTVCRLVERKGVDLVIRALENIGDQVKDLVYVVVGDGLEKQHLECDTSTYRLQGVVIFTGKVSDEELAAWYELCDVFILTTKKSEFDVEGFGIVYLEANSYGKPVIGSRVGGVPEAVIDGVNGLLVEPDNIEEIKNAIVKLFGDNELREKLGRHGKERVEREFGVERQIGRIMEIAHTHNVKSKVWIKNFRCD